MESQIFNTDQGCQFTSQAFTEVLEAHIVRISMDGKGVPAQHFRGTTLAQREIRVRLLKGFECGLHFRRDLKRYFAWYNKDRPHQGLDDATPNKVYFSQPLS